MTSQPTTTATILKNGLASVAATAVVETAAVTDLTDTLRVSAERHLLG